MGQIHYELMEVILTTFLSTDSYDLKKSVSENRLLGMWRMMTGFRQVYLGAALTLGLAAIAKTATFLLLRYLVVRPRAALKFHVSRPE